MCILHLRSTVARVEAGAEILLFDAWHVSVAPRSSRVTWGTDKVFCTVLLNVFSKLESIKWLSLHQVTWGIGSSEKKRNILYHIYTLNSLFFNSFPRDLIFCFGLGLEIVGEWVMKRQPFWIKIFHISPILLGRFCDKKEWNLSSVLCSLWGIYGRENLQCVFSLQPLQCAMFWLSQKLA